MLGAVEASSCYTVLDANARGLVGDEVPLEARIVSVADIFDALTSQRPYKKQWSLDEAFAKLSLLADQGKLDNDCVMTLTEQAETVLHVMTTYCRAG